MAVCPSCGNDNPDGFRFCGSCGAALAPDAPAREERKVVTVLFADLVGFTSRSERLDPEDVRAMLSGYHERVRAELERHGGTVEKFIGDAVMALFGAPAAHEDDPERAVRAAFAVRDAVSELGDGQLEVRVGITTGEALVDLAARPELGEGMAAGDVVNTAARLQSAAPVGGVLVDETTFRATDRLIAYREADPVTAKGKADPVRVWEAVEPRARLGVDVARPGGAPLVGRAEEIDLLCDALARTRRDRTPQLVTLIGAPGIGKSRLVAELLQIVDDDPELIRWRQGRSLPYGEGVSFWALGEMVKAEAGILETDRDEDTEAKLRASVAALLPDEEEDAAWVARQLRPLVGLDAAAGGGSPDEAYSAWRRFFEAMAESGPAVLVFEDLQWADEGLLDFVEHLVDWASGVPLLVLCTARPELLDRRPGWGGGTANATTVSLAPLTTEETARLIASLAERALMPAEVQEALLARAGGNPLYAEEFVRMASERGGDVEHLPMPESVQGIIAARLDNLDPTDKAVLQDAAVIGKVFWLGAVADLGNVPRWELERRLHGLERRQLVRRERRATVAGEREYAFWHVLVRDVAYGQIPRARRAEKHRQAAEWIESLSPERAADRADLLAHHYLAAVEYARASGQDAGPLEAPARAALAAAGERALTLNAFPAAERYFRAALELWPEADDARANALFGLGRALHAIDESGEEELEAARTMFAARGEVESAAEAEIALALLAWHRGTVSRTLEHVERAATLVEEQPPSPGKARALAAVSRYRMLGNRNVEAIAAGRQALAMAEQLGLRELTAHALNNIGTARVAAGDDRGIADLERSIEIAEEIGSIEASRGYINLASVTELRGDLRLSNELHRRGLEVAGRFGEAVSLRFMRAELLIDACLLGDWDVLPELDAYIREVEEGLPYYMEGPVRSGRAVIRLARGDAAGALADARRALEQADETREPQSTLPTLSVAAFVYAVLGDEREADRFLDRLAAEGGALEFYWAFPATFAFELRGRADELPGLLGSSVLWSRWLDASRLYANGRRIEAADVLRDAGAGFHEAYARLRAAELLVADSRRAEADDQLRQALAFFRGVGATRFVRAGERLLAASA